MAFIALGAGASAQPSFTPHDISLAANGAFSVFAVDVDGDGDIDVLSASWRNDAIRWYENDGATPPTFTARNISLAADAPESVFAADVDGDGDIDVLSASVLDNAIRWYENDGATLPTFTARDISLVAGGARSVFAADVDGDGDIDVLSASYGDDAIRWYENDGSTPPSFTPHDISLAADGAWSVFAADVDGDGDIDVLSASQLDDAIRWYENDGSTPPSFTPHDISLGANGAHSVIAADVDGDGDTDILSASWFDDAIRWYENDGASPPTFAARDISLTADRAWSVFAADVDGDGDIDVLSASSVDDAIRWYENDGSTPPTFAARDISLGANGATAVFAADLDGDGDIDVLSASTNDDAIRWYENDTIGACVVDLTTQGAGPSDPGWGVPDGLATAADINYYVGDWVAGSPAADLTTQGAGPGDPGFGVPDGLVTAADINFYVNLWVGGCP